MMLSASQTRTLDSDEIFFNFGNMPLLSEKTVIDYAVDCFEHEQCVLTEDSQLAEMQVYTTSLWDEPANEKLRPIVAHGEHALLLLQVNSRIQRSTINRALVPQTDPSRIWLGSVLPTFSQLSLPQIVQDRLVATAALFKDIDNFHLGTYPVEINTIKEAKSLISGLSSFYPLPQARPSTDGEIGLFWHYGPNRVEVIFDPEDKRVVWIGKFNGEFVSGGDEAWQKIPPESLIAMLNRLYR